MAKQIKGGYLMRYKKRLFGKTWREEWVTLFDDSTLAWFKEKDRRSPEGVLVIKDAPEMMAVGTWTLRIPARPELPSGCHVVQLMAFGNRRRDKVHWLLAKNEEEVNDWMSAISNTLPPPPQQPLKPPDDKEANNESISTRLPPVPYCSALSGNNPATVYPESEFVPASILVLDRNGALGDMKTHTNWGHGWGWTCYAHDHAEMHVAHYDSLAYDDLGDLEFGDSDFSMTFSGDFGF